MYHAHTGVVYRIELLPSLTSFRFLLIVLFQTCAKHALLYPRWARFLFQSCLGVYYGKSGILHKLMYTLSVDFFSLLQTPYPLSVSLCDTFTRADAYLPSDPLFHFYYRLLYADCARYSVILGNRKRWLFSYLKEIGNMKFVHFKFTKGNSEADGCTSLKMPRTWIPLKYRLSYLSVYICGLSFLEYVISIIQCLYK